MRTTTTTTMLLTVALLVSACGSDSDNSNGERAATPTPTPESAAASPLPKATNTSVSAGRYSTTVFEPTVTLEIPEDQTWRVSGAGDTAESVALELLAGDEVAINTLAFLHISDVADPKLGARTIDDAQPAPDDFIEWLAKHPRLKAQAPEEVTVGGVTGRAITVTADTAPKRMPTECVETSRDCVPVFFDGDEPVVYLVGDSVRYTALDVGGEQVIIEQFAAPPDQFDNVLGQMQAVMDSLQLG